MSDWRPKIKEPASFRGVPFWVESSEHGGGRRLVEHVFPFNDQPFPEDMGRKPRTYGIDAFVVGTEYLAAKEKLQGALETKGPGELIHPYFGTKRVVVSDFRVRETASEGGVARFSIQFLETPPKAAAPVATAESAPALQASAGAARAACGAEFAASFSAGRLLDSVTGQISKMTRGMRKLLTRIKMEVQAVASLKTLIDDLETNAVALANEPADLLAAQIEIFEGLADGLVSTATALNPLAPINAFVELYNFDAGTRPPATTTSRLQEQANFDALQQLTQRLVTIQACLIAAEQSFPSYDDAVSARALVTDLLDAQAEAATDDIYPTLQELRANLVKAVPGDALDLPRLVEHTPVSTIPSLVLAFRLYGDLDSEEDLIARNRVRHPAFVKGGTALEILTRG